MYLKRLEIYGFKSFGSKSVIDFNEGNKSNIAAIVGPNGSGKSNVADAIRWVLGEQSNSLLRSKKSDDIIFIGSQSKARSSYAEASLHLVDDKAIKFELNNKKHELLEIEITRKLYRSGESEYLVNKKKVRLLDIQQLLASLGFGQSTYSVIGQGMVDRLLFFNASERRMLFDEAAGIKQYKIKREQAIRKLLNTEENLIRLNDIKIEIEPQIINLRRLVKRAEGRQEIEQELDLLENCYYGSIITELKSELATFNDKKKQNENDIIKIKQKIDRLENDKSEIHVIKEMDSDEQNKKDNIDNLLIERDVLIKEGAYIQGQLEAIKEETNITINQEVALSEEEKQLNEKIAFIKKKIFEHRAEIEQESLSKKEIEEKIDSLNLKAKNSQQLFNSKTSPKESALLSINKEIEKIAEEKERLSLNINALEQEDNLNRIRFEEKKLELSSLNIILKEIEQERSKAVTRVKDYEKSINSLVERQQTLNKSVEKLTIKFTEIDQNIREKTSIIKPEELAKLERNIYEIANDHKTLVNLVEDIKTFDQLSGLRKKFNNYSLRFNNIIMKITLLAKSFDLATREKLENELLLIKSELDKETKETTVTLISLSEKRSECDRLKKEIRDFELATEEAKNKISEINKLEKCILNSDKVYVLKQREDGINKKLKRLEEEKKPLSNLQSERENAFWAERDIITRKSSLLNQELYEKKLHLAKKLNILENQEREIEGTKERLEKIKLMKSSLTVKQDIPDSGSHEKRSEIKTQLAEKEKEILYLKEELKLITEKKQHIKEKSSAIARDIELLEDQISSLSLEVNQIDLAITRLETKLEDLGLELKNLGVVLREKEETKFVSSGDRDLLKARIENMRRKKESIGDVDPETLSEYKTLESRASEMENQLGDLSRAKKNLEEIIAELDVRIKSQFSKTFSQIAHEFNRYFIMLFNGGRAEIKLETDEVSDFGVEISASLPGKKTQNLNVLSGGERTLTSLSLLFAILSINPSPFCVLDEVDAALDESNTARFSNILKDLAKKTQFIIISHNRETMKSADILYGLTMDESHISKMISVKLGEAEKLVS